MKKSIQKAFLLCSFVLFAAFFAAAQNIEPKQNPKDSKWGFVDKSTDKWVIKPKYDSVEAISQQPNGKLRGKIIANGKTGFIDEYGNVLGAGVIFEEVVPIDTDAMIVTVKGKKGIANYDGIYLIKPELTNVEALGDEGFLISKNDKKGFIKHNGSIVLDVIYNKINPDVEGYFILDKGGKAALALRDGSILLEPNDFTAIEPFGEYWLVSKKDTKGLYDLNKKSILIEPNYNDISQPFVFNDNKYFKVKKKDKWGLCDSSGNLVIKCKSNELVEIPSLKAIYAKDGLYYLPSGKKVQAYVREKTVGPFNFTYVETAEGSSCILTNSKGQTFKTNGKIRELGNYYLIGRSEYVYNLFSKEGKLIVSNIYDEPTVRNKWTILNTFKNENETEEYALSPEGELYKSMLIGDFMFIQNLENKVWTCVNIPSDLNLSFEEMKQFSGNNDLVSVKSDGLWGLLTKNGYLINPVSDEPLDKFDDSMFVYYNSGKSGLVSAQKGEIIKPKYDKIIKDKTIDDNHVKIKEGEYIGVFDIKNDKWIVPVSDKYDNIDKLSDGYLAFKGNGKRQLYDINGKKITGSPKITVKKFYKNEYGAIRYSIAYQNCTESYYKVILRYYQGGKELYYMEDKYYPTALSGNWDDGTSDLYSFDKVGKYTVKLFVYNPEGKIVAQSNNTVQLNLVKRR